MTNSRFRLLRSGPVIAALLAARPVAADGWEAARFDPPRRVETVVDAAGKQVTCTVYADLVIRESDTDTPDPDEAALIPLSGGTAPGCSAAPRAAVRRLAAGGQRFLGRRAGFLIFEQASTNGAIPFAVIDAASGRTLFEDITTHNGIDSFAVENGALRLGFRRGVQGACSIPKQGASCWSRIAREEKLPAPVAALPTPMTACATAYQAGKAPKATESIVSFPVSLTWIGSLTVAATGPVSCLPTP